MPAADVQLIVRLLQPDGFTPSDDAERAVLDRLRERLAERAGQVSGDLSGDAALLADLDAIVREVERCGPVEADAIGRLRATVRRDEGNHEEAIAGYEELLARHPGDVDALFWSAVCLRHLGRHPEARARLLAASDLADADDLVLIASELTALDDRQTAAKLLAQADAGAGDARAADGDSNLSDKARLLAADAWVELDEPSRAIGVMAPLLRRDGQPTDEEITAYLQTAQVSTTILGDTAAVIADLVS